MQKLYTILLLSFILILFNGMNQYSTAQVLEQDSLALVALYDSTDGANWIIKTNWLTGPVSTWYGVTVTGDRVTEVEIRWNNLVGTIPPEIGNLTAVTYLSLIQNNLSGPIPNENGNLINLTKLALTSNQLSNSIPPEIGNLSNLKFLGLEVNNLSGSIPVEIGNLTNLTLLTVNQNNLSGAIPVELFNLTNLQTLFLNMNKLSGPIPPQIGNLTKLEYVSFYGNQLEGQLPSEIQNLTQLILFNVSLNQFTGTIPGWIGNLINLHDLSMGRNQFSGAIPPEIGNLTKLTSLYLAHNELSESIPPEVGLPDLISLNLEHNKLVGPVPASLGNLSKLEQLWLYDNELTDLPDLSADTSLVSLQIHYNKFTFEDIEPNLFVTNFIYSPQDSVGEEQDTTINPGSNLELSVSVGGTANQYQWIKDGEEILDADSSSYTIISADSADAGSYVCRITNTIAANLTLFTRPFQVTVSGSVGVKDYAASNPQAFVLYQNYPNPFNPSTIINFVIPKTSFVTIKVYDNLGKEIATLVNESMPLGNYEIKFDVTNLSSGVYFYRMISGSYAETKKMLLLR